MTKQSILQASNLPATPTASFAMSWLMKAMLGGVLASSLPKLQFWQPQALTSTATTSKVGLILFYLRLSLHLP